MNARTFWTFETTDTKVLRAFDQAAVFHGRKNYFKNLKKKEKINRKSETFFFLNINEYLKNTALNWRWL